MKLVAVTSCPTGIAHTYMAAEALEQAARDAGHEIKVETQGAAGATPLPPEDIAAADGVVFAADVEVRDRERFAGKPLVQGPVKRAIQDASGMLAEVERAAQEGAVGIQPAEAAAGGGGGDGPALASKVDQHGHFGTRLRGWLMTGVSYMIPFVAAGGILIALAFMIGGARVAAKVNGGEFEGVTYEQVTDLTRVVELAGWAGLLFAIGSLAFSMLVPILSGFIAFAMADRPGIVPGIVGGLIANQIGAGFLGGLASGLMAGGIVMGIKMVNVHRALAGVMPVVIIPLISTFVVGVLMLVVVGRPIAAAQKALTDWLGGLTGTNAILLGALLGLMMAFDMGGPINKVAYTFGLASLTANNYTVMAAVMAAGMVPPLAMALATVLRKNMFTKAERAAGETAWLLGASFITEGAIPFAAADPLRVIPSMMAGSATTGALSMAFGCTSRAPHGGIWVIGLIGRPLLYILAIAIGMAVSTACVIALKTATRGADTEVEAGPTTQPAPAAG
jgi:fructose PTS system EIIBC or EIIC component